MRSVQMRGLVLPILLLAAGCASAERPEEIALAIIDVGRYDFVGGASEDPSRVAEELSGLDRLSGDTYVAVSDEHACLHTLAIEVDRSTGAVSRVEFAGSLDLLDETGAGATEVGDREGVAVAPSRDAVWISHEETGGDRGSSSICEHSLQTGRVTRRVDVAGTPDLAVFARGRENRGWEAFGGQPDGGAYWAANEEALREDGEPGSTESGTTVRLQKFAADMSPVAQYAYVVDPVSGPITAPAALARSGIRGVSDLEVLPGGTVLVLERSFDGDSTGFAKNTIGIYEVDFSRATDVSGIAALRGMHYTPVEKRKLIELTFPLSNSNYEGMALGPRLENGDHSLLLIADNHSGTNQSVYALRLSGL